MIAISYLSSLLYIILYLRPLQMTIPLTIYWAPLSNFTARSYRFKPHEESYNMLCLSILYFEYRRFHHLILSLNFQREFYLHFWIFWFSLQLCDFGFLSQLSLSLFYLLQRGLILLNILYFIKICFIFFVLVRNYCSSVFILKRILNICLKLMPFKPW